MKFFILWHFSVTYNVSITKTKLYKHAHRLNVFFLACSMIFNFLAFKTKGEKILKIKITAIFFYQFVLNSLYYR